MIYIGGNTSCIKEDNSFTTIKDFDRNKIIVFNEKIKEFTNSSNQITNFRAVWHIAKEPFRSKDNWPDKPFLHYHKFKPFISILKKLIDEKCGIEETISPLLIEKDILYKKYCKEDSFWIDVKNKKEEFSNLPNIIGTLINDKFMVLDGYHRSTLYCINEELSINFDIL